MLDTGFAVTLLFALPLWVAVNLPLLWVFKEHDWDVFPQLLGHAPNQFLFLLAFFPVGLVAAIHAWSLEVGSNDWLPAHWSLLAFAGGLLAVIFAVQEYLYGIPDYDELSREYAKWAVQADRTVWDYLGNAPSSDAGKERTSILSDAAEKLRGSERILALRLSMDMDARAKAVEACRFLQILAAPTNHERQVISDKVSCILNAIELAVDLLVAWFTIWGCVEAAVGSAKNTRQADTIAFSLVISVLMLATFAIFRIYNRFEVKFVSGREPAGLSGHVWTAAAFFLCVAALLTYYFPHVEVIKDTLEVISIVVTAVLTFLVIKRPETLRNVIGGGAMWPNMLMAIVVVSLWDIFLVLVIFNLVSSAQGGVVAR